MVRNFRLTATFVYLLGSIAAHAQNSLPPVKGTIEKIDAAAGKISIAHEDIPNLQMEGGMTMVFKVGDPAMLKGVKAGDKVRFTADRVNGQITVTTIKKGQ